MPIRGQVISDKGAKTTQREDGVFNKVLGQPEGPMQKTSHHVLKCAHGGLETQSRPTPSDSQKKTGRMFMTLDLVVIT